MIVNQASLQGLNVSYSTAYNKAFSGVSTNYQEYATVVPSASAETNYKWLGQIPQMREWVGERELQNISAYDYSIKNKHFEMTVSVNRDDIEDDQYGVYTPMFSSMGESAASHPDELCMGVLKNGFTGVCYDGKSFFASDHKIGNDTYSNVSNEKLSVESYITARTAIMSIKGDKGKSLKLVPNLLIVSPANEHVGKLILEADEINGTTNVYKGTAKLLVDPELADMPSAWFLLCTNKFLKPIVFQKRKEIKLVSYTKETDPNVFKNNEFVWGADGRSNAGYGFWQMAYGSTGESTSGTDVTEDAGTSDKTEATPSEDEAQG